MAAFHRHNKDLRRALKMARARARLYRNEPQMLLYDLRKYRAY
jgi:hypothetical protein